jgi:hypothetical protein
MRYFTGFFLKMKLKYPQKILGMSNRLKPYNRLLGYSVENLYCSVLFSLAKTLYHNDRITIMNVT